MRRLLPIVVLAAACRGEAPRTPTGDEADARFAALVDTLTPAVEKSVGLSFREPPRSAVRSREQVRRYLEAKLDEELPPERLRGIETAYRLFGLIADSIELRPLMLDLLTEQVVGFYDPDSAMLFGVEGGNPAQLRLVLAHEMVHALQGQYVFADYTPDWTTPDPDPHGTLLVATPGADTSATWPWRRLSVADDALNHFFVTGMGEDAAGELYVMARHQFGPIGQTGFVFRIVPPVS